MSMTASNTIIVIVLLFSTIPNVHSSTRTRQLAGSSRHLLDTVQDLQLNRDQTYSGPVDDKRRPHGIGILRDAEGEYTYEGEFVHGLKTGFGRFQYDDGDVFGGLLNNGVYVTGTFHYKQPDPYLRITYVGDFDEYDQPESTQGTLSLHWKREFTGKFVDGFPTEGKMKFVDGSETDAVFIDGEFIYL